MIHSSRHSARRRQQRRRLVRAMSLGIVLGVTDRQSLDKPLRLATREPGFYAITNSHIEPAEARDVAALRQRLVLRLHNATVPEALKAIDDQTSLRFVFKQSILPPDATISLDAGDISVAAALTQIFMDADVGRRDRAVRARLDLLSSAAPVGAGWHDRHHRRPCHRYQDARRGSVRDRVGRRGDTYRDHEQQRIVSTLACPRRHVHAFGAPSWVHHVAAIGYGRYSVKCQPSMSCWSNPRMRSIGSCRRAASCRPRRKSS